jgi:hypothetical protein
MDWVEMLEEFFFFEVPGLELRTYLEPLHQLFLC